jgi:tetratricopeptide (TPR) repeat protein
LQSYYGDDPESAPRSIEMDLARFEFLLRADSGRGSGGWLDAIQRRGGDYARRRAEAVALSLLGRSEKANDTIDPAIVAAQGQDYLRRGDPQRAAELLAAAARAETNQNRAVSRAAESAAAFGMAQRYQQAAAVLSEIAVANPEATQAAAAHLQAAVLIASHAPQQVEQLEAILRSNLKQWPDADTASGARRWLLKILSAQERQIEAAEVASDVSPDRIDAETLDGMEKQWRIVFRTAEDRSAEVSRRFLEAFEPLLVNPEARSRFVLLAALLVDRGQLSQLQLESSSQSSDPFAAALVEFRRRGSDAQPLKSPRPEIIEDATERLMRDGRENVAQRPSIARVLEGWPGNDQPSLDRAERLIWLGRTRDAIDLVKQWMQADPGSADVTRQSARLLQQSRDPLAIAEAIRLWDQLASGAPRGSKLWHEAKLAAISALRESGKVEEARRRARYLLLTMPTMDQATRDQYESLAE